MDDPRLELLSRHLDGDLGDDETRQLEERLAAEPDLAAELAALVRVREEVRALARSEPPPARLDAAVEPLRRTVAARATVRPAFRWLAAAATLVLGLSVGYRVAQRGPSAVPPSGSSRQARTENEARKSEKPYPLAPLPGTEVPPERQLLGAADRLVASPVPPVEVPLPVAQTAVGPLDSASSGLEQGSSNRRSAAVSADQALDQATAVREADRSPTAGGVSPSAARARGQAPAAASAEAKAPASARLATEKRGVHQLGSLVLRASQGEVSIPFHVPADCPPLHARLQVTVVAGVVDSLALLQDRTGQAVPEAAVNLDALVGVLRGRPVPQLADGQYPGEVVIPDPGLAPQPD